MFATNKHKLLLVRGGSTRVFSFTSIILRKPPYYSSPRRWFHASTRPLFLHNNRQFSSAPLRQNHENKNPEQSSSLLAKICDNTNSYMLKQRPLLPTSSSSNMSLSEAAGNLSFVCVTTAYLCQDILTLRLLAMGSIFLSMVFQFYRLQPLWIPIRWNSLLLVINVGMVTVLLWERHQAEQMDPDLEHLYQAGHFGRRGFGRVEFRRFINLAAGRLELDAGTFLARQGEPNDTLYLIVRGDVSIVVKQEGRLQGENEEKTNDSSANTIQVAVVKPYHFINEMAFLNYAFVASEEDDEEAGEEDQDNKPSTARPDPQQLQYLAASADAIVGPGGAVVWYWSFDTLQSYLHANRQVSNALSAYLNHDLRAKLMVSSSNSTACTVGGTVVETIDNQQKEEEPPEMTKKAPQVFDG